MAQREIKFRFWRDGKMQQAHQLNAYVNTDNNFSGDGEILMQYTGLKDKNGVEIYEGDIVRCSSSLRCPHEVVWMEEVPNQNFGGAPGFYLSGLMAGYSFTGDEEVIGNIHQHPHLLK